ncbi:hypothetical protein SAMN05444007_107104 [Cribrihabitans marinus]|uniref:Uncharacterized protein n=1 Tax=Cribrihabitans marinus TaxID=1227549 RepID=A0A1H7BQN9_9RHOB|nr:hypothetical protein [Cribrihabitans marinus]GGH34195.1 hypothetical protein GCM10010973_26710 [Cribrihabitans marinus]SEJ78647.1 hypothetical protein SAMN05444007_107104 [Cribrihabitans marinus]
MSGRVNHGGAPVGQLAHLDPLRARAVKCLRTWTDDPQTRTGAVAAMSRICGLCASFGRRPLIRHAPDCAYLGADESCFATLVAAAADGAREDALLMACLIVRPDMAPVLAALAEDLGLALRRDEIGRRLDTPQTVPAPVVLH